MADDTVAKTQKWTAQRPQSAAENLEPRSGTEDCGSLAVVFFDGVLEF